LQLWNYLLLFIDVDEEQNARIETWLVLDNISGLSSTMALPFEGAIAIT
jgi:hypothetical protein